MPNPRVPDDIKKARGTYRADRAEPKEAQTETKKPRRPSHLTGYAEQLWKRHFNELWSSGRLTRRSVEAFILTCELYQQYCELRDDIVENGKTEVVSTQFTSKTVERPQWKMCEKLSNDLYKWFEKLGISDDAVVVEKDEKKPKNTNGKPENIKDFLHLAK
jgi:P27 family predicted phage terminase small subunit